MKISIIGSGNIATFFANKFLDAGHEILQIISPTVTHAELLARQVHCSFEASLAQLNEKTDVCLFAVKDDILTSIVEGIDFKQKILIHTAGSLTLGSLLDSSRNVGSIWCMYSINKNHLPLRKDIPLIINASNPETLRKVETLAAAISNSIFSLTDEKKQLAHLAAVFANNFANHMFTIGQDLLMKENISFDLLIPLIENTVEKLMFSSPDKLQTGPAIRHDEKTIEKHKDLLKDQEDYRKIYDLLTSSIQKKYTA